MDLMDFSGFAGNDRVKGQISRLVVAGRIPHTLIIEGECGVGKATLAGIIAKALVCRSATLEDRPCGFCTDCKKACDRIHPDIIFPEKSGTSGAFSVDTIRAVRRDAYVKPNEACCKVYVFRDTDNMGIPAQNALLKLLEEPPSNVFFLLTCVSVGALLPTVKSRAQVFSLVRVSVSGAVEYITNKQEGFAPEDITKSVERAGGNIGRALETLTSGTGVDTATIAEKLALATVSACEFDILACSALFVSSRVEFKNAVLAFKYIMKCALVCMHGQDMHASDCVESVASKLNTDKIINVIEFVDEVVQSVDRNGNLQLMSAYVCAGIRRICFCEYS